MSNGGLVRVPIRCPKCGKGCGRVEFFRQALKTEWRKRRRCTRCAFAFVAIVERPESEREADAVAR